MSHTTLQSTRKSDSIYSYYMKECDNLYNFITAFNVEKLMKSEENRFSFKSFAKGLIVGDWQEWLASGDKDALQILLQQNAARLLEKKSVKFPVLRTNYDVLRMFVEFVDDFLLVQQLDPVDEQQNELFYETCAKDGIMIE